MFLFNLQYFALLSNLGATNNLMFAIIFKSMKLDISRSTVNINSIGISSIVRNNFDCNSVKVSKQDENNARNWNILSAFREITSSLL